MVPALRCPTHHRAAQVRELQYFPPPPADPLDVTLHLPYEAGGGGGGSHHLQFRTLLPNNGSDVGTPLTGAPCTACPSTVPQSGFTVKSLCCRVTLLDTTPAPGLASRMFLAPWQPLPVLEAKKWQWKAREVSLFCSLFLKILRWLKRELQSFAGTAALAPTEPAPPCRLTSFESRFWAQALLKLFALLCFSYVSETLKLATFVSHDTFQMNTEDSLWKHPLKKAPSWKRKKKLHSCNETRKNLVCHGLKSEWKNLSSFWENEGIRLSSLGFWDSNLHYMCLLA